MILILTKRRVNRVGRADCAGFTLVEALVALAIMTLAITLLVGSTARATKAQMVSEHYNVALALAGQKLTDVALDGPSYWLSDEGEFDEPHEQYAWRVESVEFDDLAGLYRVEVEIAMPGGRAFETTTFLYEADTTALGETEDVSAK